MVFFCTLFQFWVTGGLGSSPTSTDLIDEHGSTPGVELPRNIGEHCMTYMNGTHGIILGGGSGNGHKTLMVELSNFQFTEGPLMNVYRAEHACSYFHAPNGTNYVIVAGGGSASDKTEILNVDDVELGWYYGKKYEINVQSMK